VNHDDDIPLPTDDDYNYGPAAMSADGVEALSNVVPIAGRKNKTKKNKEPTVLSPGALARHPAWTSVDFAHEFVRRHGHDLWCASESEDWLIWNGKHWKENSIREAELRAERFTTAMLQEAKDATVPEGEDEEELKYKTIGNITSRLTHHHIREMCQLARKQPGVNISQERMNKRLDLLSVANCTINLRDGSHFPHRREDGATFVSDIPYDPDANCPVWEEFLDYTFYGSDEMIDFVQRLMGYTLTGETKEQKFFFLHGDGGRGKSTFIETLARILGKHAQAVPTSFIELLRIEEHPASLASTFGKRMVLTSETREGRVMDEVRVKQFTGEDTVSARRMCENFFTFRPIGKLFVAGNHKPVIMGADEGVWRRMVLIEFNREVTEEMRASNLKERIEAELPGIMAWAVRGAAAWYQQGLLVPAAIAEATASYRKEQNVFDQFIQEHFVTGKGGWVISTTFRAVYEGWCKDNGVMPLAVGKVGARMRKYGSESKSVKESGKTKQAWVNVYKRDEL